MNETNDVRLARIEERMVMLVTGQNRIEKTVDSINAKLQTGAEKQYDISGKLLAVAGTCSVLVTVVVTMLIHVMSR